MDPIVRVVLDGYNVCIIIDGQSDAGKSYTIFNSEFSIALSAAIQIFTHQHTNTARERECHVYFSVLEILADTPYDLLASKSQRNKIPIQIQNLPEKTIFKDLEMTEALTLKILISLLQDIIASRKIRSTEKNSVSSRGHAITIITLTQGQAGGELTTSRLFLVDLVGSEKRQETTDKEAMREASTISTDRESLKKMFLAHGKRATGKNLVLNRDTKVCCRTSDDGYYTNAPNS